MPDLVMMVGIPCSGKDTFINMCLCKPEHFNNNKRVSIISLDDIIEEVAIHLHTTYTDIFSSISKFADKEMKRRTQEYLKEDNNVVWNQTNLSVNSRKGKLSQVSQKFYKICVNIVPPSTDIIMQRNKERFERTGKNIPSQVIVDMIKSYQPPNFSEGFDEIWTVNNSLDGTSFLIDFEDKDGTFETKLIT